MADPEVQFPKDDEIIPDGQQGHQLAVEPPPAEAPSVAASDDTQNEEMEVYLVLFDVYSLIAVLRFGGPNVFCKVYFGRVFRQSIFRKMIPSA